MRNLVKIGHALAVCFIQALRRGDFWFI